MKHSVYLFDFDGTLVDSMPTWAGQMTNILDKRNVSYPDNLIEIITPLGTMGCLEYFRNELGMVFENDEVLAEMLAFALPAYRDKIPAKDGVIDYLKSMKEKGHRLCVLTASPHITLDPCLKRIGIFDIFENVWSCDDFNTTKANPEIYHMVAEKLSVEIGEIAFFDDNINAIETAKTAGTYTVGIFDETGKGFIKEMKETADVYFETLKDAEEV